ncbi:M23 family metallopeptidase [Streptomyces amakusaensis]|uniref:M23 family metallopeptidase n=1 Tax=Streptomyces amakusaensis TaxID=67271 RepID=A0ABW0AVK5_9ACTN
MASNTPAPESPFRTGVFSEGGAAPSVGEWNPTAETVRPVRGRHRHRVMKQRGGFARSSTVLGVGVIAAVGAGGIATAQNKPAVSISLPDALVDSLPDVEDLPGVGSFMSDDAAEPDTADTADTASYETMGGIGEEVGASRTTAAEALRSRILEQAEEQQAGAEAAATAAAEKAAAEKAAKAAEKAEREAEKEAEEKAKKKAEAEAAAKKAEEKKAADAAAAKAAEKAEAERVAKLTGSFSLPTSSYRITATYGQSGPMWSSGQHTGLDFAAPAGTPVKAVGGATVKSAGWSGAAYGYLIVLQLSDGTEAWYAHLSSMTVSAGQKVAPGETIGRVGSTGNSSAPHLHLEIKTSGGSGIDPMAWLRGKGLTV